MSKQKWRNIPIRDPFGGGPLYISELASEDGITIRGRFDIPRLATLDHDQLVFLETFLRCRGMISSVEKELGISYPTVRARLDTLLEALELAPVKDDKPKKDKSAEKKRKILDQLEKGEITPEEAKAKLRGGQQE